MNFVKKFKSFLTNTKHHISSNFDDNSLIRDEMTPVDSEIVDTCNDILRDFNEDNNCDLKISLCNIMVANTNSRIMKFTFYDKIISSDGLDILLDKSNIIDLTILDRPGIDYDNKAIIMLAKHIISYFKSLGYNYKHRWNNFNIPHFYFYKD